MRGAGGDLVLRKRVELVADASMREASRAREAAVKEAPAQLRARRNVRTAR